MILIRKLNALKSYNELNIKVNSSGVLIFENVKGTNFFKMLQIKPPLVQFTLELIHTQENIFTSSGFEKMVTLIFAVY